MNVITVNVATQTRARGCLGTPNPFDLGTQKLTPARKEAPRTERNIRPAEVGCVDWYLYPVNKKPGQSER